MHSNPIIAKSETKKGEKEMAKVVVEIRGTHREKELYGKKTIKRQDAESRLKVLFQEAKRRGEVN